jgi:hypothetical protein
VLDAISTKDPALVGQHGSKRPEAAASEFEVTCGEIFRRSLPDVDDIYPQSGHVSLEFARKCWTFFCSYWTSLRTLPTATPGKCPFMLC